MNKKNNKGFSLIELVIVITIMVILTALLAPQLLRYVEQSRAAKDGVTIDEVKRAVELALTDETVYKSLAATGNSVTYANTGTITVTGSTANALADELFKTLGGTHTAAAATISGLPAFVSNAYKDKTITYTITISTTTGATVTWVAS